MSSAQPGTGPAEGGNPVMASYERWSATTPLVTRATLVGVVAVYLLSWIIDLEMSLGNIPYYSIMKFEVYRIFLSFLVGNSILSLVMIAFFFPAMAGRMENSLGSAGLLILMGSVALITNVLFDLLCITMSVMGDPKPLFWSCDNFWIIVFGLITIECMQIPDAPRRMMFIPVDIPSKYFPIALYAFFCLFSGLMLSYFLAIGVGYCFSMGYFDKLKVSDTTLAQSESSGWLSGLSRRAGWVPVGSALGHQAWTAQAPGQAQAQQGGSGVMGMPRGGPRVFGLGSGGGEDVEAGRGAAKAETEPLMEHFPGSGRKLASSGASKVSREQMAAQRLSALGVARSGNSSSSSAASAPPMVQNSDVTKLVDMGFPRSQAHDALIKANGSYEGAVDILMNGR